MPDCDAARGDGVNFGSICAMMMSVVVKVFGCRPHEGGAARTGPAYANLQRRKPREGIRQTVRRALSKSECRM